jgi:putative DNA primase/helicase
MPTVRCRQRGRRAARLAHFKCPDGVKIKNSTGELAPGVDVRGEGGMVLAPPSVKPGVGAYEWITEADIADAPQWLLDLVKEKKREQATRVTPYANAQADPDEITKALAAIVANLSNTEKNWDKWNGWGMMIIYVATSGSDEGKNAFDALSQKARPPAPDYNADDVIERWDHWRDSPPDRYTVRSLFWLADQASPGWRGVAPVFSEEDLALRFSQRHGDELRFVAKWGQWYRYDGQRWKPDDTRKTFSLARDLCRDVACKVNKPREAKAIASGKTRMAVVSLASDDRRHAATVDQWDADLWLLNTPDGVIDLRSGERREACADDYMTKITSVAPNADCPTPLWSAFLEKVTAGDKDLQAFLQRMSGYSLTGSIREHALFFLYGTGSNGKGVFMNVKIGIMGDYHRAAPIETFTETHTDNHPTELAMLRGARMVTSTETEKGRRWAESRIKMLTGGDVISARFMRQDFFDYRPQFKLTIAGNHKPGLQSVDEAIRRRLHLIPFVVTIPEAERDEKLGDKLVAEYPGILHWMIQGCLDWQQKGLAAPVAVKEATEDYLGAQDKLKMWLDDCCFIGPDEWTETRSLFDCWGEWCAASGEKVGTIRDFTDMLVAKGFSRHKRTERGFYGLTIYKPGGIDRIWKGKSARRDRPADDEAAGDPRPEPPDYDDVPPPM